MLLAPFQAIRQKGATSGLVTLGIGVQQKPFLFVFFLGGATVVLKKDAETSKFEFSLEETGGNMKGILEYSKKKGVLFHGYAMAWRKLGTPWLSRCFFKHPTSDLLPC